MRFLQFLLIVRDYQASGGPGWAVDRSGDAYDSAAKAEGDVAPGIAEARLMLQALLAVVSSDLRVNKWQW
jgi:hypothetical protein